MAMTADGDDARTYWLSFAGDDGFRGVAIVRVSAAAAAAERPLLPPLAQPGAEWVAAAVRITHQRGCNPGGQVLATALASAPAPQWLDRLLTATEARQLGGDRLDEQE